VFQAVSSRVRFAVRTNSGAHLGRLPKVNIMSSQASWQTGGAGWGEGFPDEQSVESLLRRLLVQVEETERRYSDALDELQGRLDQLALKTDAVRSGATGGGPALDRLHDQVSGLARRFEREASSSLDDFERLGRAVMGGLDRDASGFSFDPSAPPFTSPTPELSAVFPSFPPLPEADSDLSQRLIEMAHRLEHSVDAAMTPRSLDDLHARIDAVGRQIADALATLPKPVSLEPLELQIAYIAHKLGRAETELAKIGDIETALHRLIERMDSQAGQLGDVAAKAATEAARLVSGEATLDAATAERLDTMHRDLMAMNARSSAADDRLAGSIEAVHQSLKQLVLETERSASRATALGQHMALPERMPEAHGESESAKGSLAAKPVHAKLPEARPIETRPLEARPLEARPPFGRAKRAGSGDTLVDLDEERFVDLDVPLGSRSLVKRVARTETEMENDLVAAARRAAQAAARRAAERTAGDMRKWAPAGARAPSRVETPRADTPHVQTHRPEAVLRRGRPLLIIAAAVLLVLSAILLYSRLQTKPWPDFLAPAAEESAPLPSAPTENSPLPGAGDKAPDAEPEKEAAPEPGNVPPDAAANPPRDAAGDTGKSANVTDIAKSSYWPATVVEEPVEAVPATGVEATRQAEPAALRAAQEPQLPPGAVFTVEDPSRSF
jgi:localization factor PodJL